MSFKVSRGSNTAIYYTILVLFLASIITPNDTGDVNATRSLIDRRVEVKMLEVPDTVSGRSYRITEDSVRRIVTEENEMNLSTAKGWGVFSVGLSRKGKKLDAYYFYLRGYRLDRNADFYTENGRNYIQWTEHRSNVQHKEETNARIIRDHHYDDAVMFPVSKTGYIIILSIFGIIALLILYFTIRVCFVYARRLLSNIARGKVFEEENILYLEKIAGYLLFFGLVAPLINIVVHIAFAAYIPASVHFLWYHTLIEYSFVAIAGLVALLFAKAFRKGYEMEQDQEYTV